MKSTRTVQDILNEIGFGWAQILSLICGGFVFFADGAELLLIGSVTRALKEEWELEAWKRGGVVSIVFIGMLFGSLVAGRLGDLGGRRLPIILSYAGVAVFSWASAAAWNFWPLIVFRLLVGFCIGIGVPSYAAYYPEACSTNSRFLVGCIAQASFGLGSAYSGLLIYLMSPDLKNLNWRLLIVYGTIPAVVCLVLSLIFFLESPVWLANKGKTEQARGVLDKMKEQNRCLEVDTEFTEVITEDAATQQDEEDNRWEVMSRRHYFFTMIAMMFSIFNQNFVYYGTMYALPQVLPDVSLYVSPAVNLIICGLIEIPGYIIAYYIADTMYRKTMMHVYLVGVILSIAAFSLGSYLVVEKSSDLTERNSKIAVGIVLGSLFMNKAVGSIGWIVNYLYLAEVFPPKCRTTAMGTVMAVGRFGSILCPIGYEYLYKATGSFQLYFILMGVLSFLNIFFVVALPIETFGADIDMEFNEMAPLNRATLRRSSTGRRLSSQFTTVGA